jgi:hypothetical protein
MLFIVSCSIVVSVAFSAFAQQRGQAPAGAQPNAGAQRGQAPAANAGPMEDRRPPLFLKETFKMDKMEEIYLSQVNIASPDVDLKIYGQTQAKWVGKTHDEARQQGIHGGIEIVWRPSPKDDPTFIFWGPCFTPCAIAFRDRNNLVDLTDLAKIKWRTKQTGYHQMQPIIKTADGRWYIGDYMEGPSTDWLEREFSIIDLRWKELDVDSVTTRGNGAFVATPDLSRIDEVGVASLASGAISNAGHGSSSAARLDWIEIYGRPVKR